MTQQPYYAAYEPQNKKKKVPTWVWVVLISLLVVGLIVALAAAVANRADRGTAGVPAGTDYVAVLHVEGTMTESAAAYDLYGGTYDQAYLLDTLEKIAADDHNKGLLLYIDSPGGEVMAASDLGDAVVAYKEATGRPVYAYGHNYAASGGYWLAAAADRFYVNRYCTTGSIGVTFGDMFDFSGLLEKYGVKVNTITSGDQKSMGSSWEQMSPETRAIFQSIIDEYYGYFL
ncbi:MAG: S49 family peptidase, partial [Firmicutes bacterium]|nr:S49 family peptidase [Bacillota bacterium]